MKQVAQLLLLGYVVVMLMGADAKEARFQRLGDKIMCSCGCAEMLLKCNHVGCPNSDRMIRELHALTGTLAGPGSTQVSGIEEQSDDEAVLNWFRRTWGVTAVVEPATHGLELWVWIVPPVALALGLALAIIVVRHWHNRATSKASGVTDVALDPNLESFRAQARRETEI